ncbi:MAG: glycosyltransferase [Candidatus Kapabacteria bacterium]|jgi:glycosyltransferase involved in cell wall biosynthesis|nr:glycosyltransferase [Candidatus Kapabacteria bacterium]
MKIAYLSTFYPFRGGIAQFNALLYRVLEKQHDINAYTFSRQYPKILFPGSSQMVGENDPADKIPSKQVLDTINPITYFTASGKINRFSPDLMLMKFWMPFFAPSLGHVAKSTKRHGTINISVLDNVIPHERRTADIALTKLFLNQNHGFVVMSKKVEQDLLSLKPDAKYIFHEHPLYEQFGEAIPKDEACKKLNIPADKKVLLYFGFIRDYKGLDLLIDSLKYLPDEYVALVAGEVYGNFDKYSKQIKDSGLTDRVILNVRYIGDEEVPVFFSAADVSVLSYKSATQSGIVGISYNFDLPVIATDVGGLKEMIAPHNTGLMTEGVNAEQIAATVKRYFDENLQTELANNIREYKKICSWDGLAADITAFYESLKD